MTATRVLVVDDSPFARKVFREVLARAPDIVVVGSARDGLEALEEISRLSPDVITLDLMMPNLDGVGLLQQLPEELRRRVVVVSVSDKDSEPAVKALQLGAFDVVRKPTAMASEALFAIGQQLSLAVRHCADAAAWRARSSPAAAQASTTMAPRGEVKLILIGASTGGPAAITRIVPELPADFPVPIVVALHIPPGYTGAFAERLDGASAVSVHEAGDGERLLPGTVVIAPGGSHLTLAGDAEHITARVRAPPDESSLAPSVDLLFESGAQVVGAPLLAVVLTGMGEDGLVGAREVTARGGAVIAESWSSAVVYGMPRAVVEAGLTSGVVPIERMAERLIELTRPSA